MENQKSGSIIVEDKSENVEFILPKHDKGIIRYDKDSEEFIHLPFKKVDGFSVEKRKWSELSDSIFLLVLATLFIGLSIVLVYQNLPIITASIISVIVIGTVAQFVYKRIGSEIYSTIRSDKQKIILRGDFPRASTDWVIPLLKDSGERTEFLGLLKKGIESGS